MLEPKTVAIFSDAEIFTHILKKKKKMEHRPSENVTNFGYFEEYLF